MTTIYLDYNATTPVAPEVRRAMLPFLDDLFGNPSSGYDAGLVARAAVEHARGQVARLIGARPNEVIFTSGGTESDNLAVMGHLPADRLVGTHIVASAVEHPAVLQSLAELERRGTQVTLVPPGRDGVIDTNRVIDAVRPDTSLITIMHSNNELGSLQPVAEIAAAIAGRDIVMHSDAAQSMGKVAIDVAELGVDMLTIAGHKLAAPKGIGALWVRSGTHLSPLLFGGGQERGLRPGTEPVPGIVGLGVACDRAAAALPRNQIAMRVLRDRFETQLLAQIPDVQINAAAAPRLPNTSHVSFLGRSGATILGHAPALVASTGSACHDSSQAPSHVLQAIGASPATIAGAVRFSFGPDTTAADLARAVAALVDATRR